MLDGLRTPEDRYFLSSSVFYFRRKNHFAFCAKKINFAEKEMNYDNINCDKANFKKPASCSSS